MSKKQHRTDIRLYNSSLKQTIYLSEELRDEALVFFGSRIEMNVAIRNGIHKNYTFRGGKKETLKSEVIQQGLRGTI